MTIKEVEMLRKMADELEKEAKEVKDEKKTPENPEKKGETQKDEAIALAKEIGKSFAEAVKEEKEAKKEVEVQTAKILTANGVREVSFPTDLSSLSDEEKIVTWFKALILQGSHPDIAQPVLRALNEGTAAEGGNLVPTPLATEIWRILPDMSVMRKIARVIPMTSQTLDLNTLSARPYAYWVSEYAEKTTTSAEFGQETLTAHDLVCLLPVTEQLAADANINVVSFITELFAEAIATEEDRTFFAGTGTGQPTGVNTYTLGATVAAGGALTMDHIIALIDSVPQKIRNSASAAFVGHSYVKRLCRQLKDTANNYIWRDSSVGRMSGQTERLPDTLYGYPFYEQNDLAQSELYFGDWKYYIIGDRKTLEVRTTTEGGESWRRNSIEIKAVVRVDGLLILTNALAKITGI